MRIGRKFVAFGISTALLVGGAGSALVVNAAHAGATATRPAAGLNHKFVQNGNHPNGFGDGLAIEGSAKFKFSCNEVTGEYSVKLKGWNVIDSDHVTPFVTRETPSSPKGYWIAVTLTDLSGQVLEFGPKQDPKTGLFGLNVTGTLIHRGLCASTVHINVITYDQTESYFPYFAEGVLT